MQNSLVYTRYVCILWCLRRAGFAQVLTHLFGVDRQCMQDSIYQQSIRCACLSKWNDDCACSVVFVVVQIRQLCCVNWSMVRCIYIVLAAEFELPHVSGRRVIFSQCNLELKYDRFVIRQVNVRRNMHARAC